MKSALPLLLLAASFILACQQSPSEEIAALNQNSVIDGDIITQRTSAASRSVVSLDLIDDYGQVVTYCTGVLIGPHTVLSAGHCFSREFIKGIRTFNVRFENRYDTASSRDIRKGLEFSRHPKFNAHEVLDNDLAVGIFKGDLPQGYTYVAMNSETKKDYTDASVYVYGFGRRKDYTGRRGEDLRYSSGNLSKGTLKIYNYTAAYDRYFTSEKTRNHLCQGDSGGPQFVEVDGVVKVLGINSGSYGDILDSGLRSCLGKSQATKVGYFYNWVKDEEAKMLRRYYH